MEKSPQPIRGGGVMAKRKILKDVGYKHLGKKGVKKGKKVSKINKNVL